MRLTKSLIIIPTICYGFIPPFADFNTTHVMNPNWPGHARFHTLWLLFMGIALATFSLVLLFKKLPDELSGLRIGGIIGLCVYFGFFTSFFTKGMFGATLSDNNGVPTMFGIDANLGIFQKAKKVDDSLK